MKWSKLILIGILTYSVFLILQLPITHVLAQLQPLPEKIQVYGVQGTIISGNAMLVEKEPWRVENIEWNLYTWPLIKGRLEYIVTFHNTNDASGRIRIGTTFLGRPYLSRSRAHIPINALAPLWQPLTINISGRINIRLDYLNWNVNNFGTKGELTLENIGWENNPLGNFFIELETINAVDKTTLPIIIGKINDQNGPFQFNGQIQLDTTGGWRLTGKLKPRANAPTSMRHMLTLIGQPDTDGVFNINFNGHLPIKLK